VKVVGDVLVNNGVAGICIQFKKTGWSVTTLEHMAQFKTRVRRGCRVGITYCVHQLHDSRESPAATACL
jgi:hypothetical protein